ncbi:MAG: hypothetical protein LBJ67_03245 [Planctomycetaceae bacterium]|nr:hypothetical protein [Planctomycetaceae bacterium]
MLKNSFVTTASKRCNDMTPLLLSIKHNNIDALMSAIADATVRRTAAYFVASTIKK